MGCNVFVTGHLGLDTNKFTKSIEVMLQIQLNTAHHSNKWDIHTEPVKVHKYDILSRC